MNGTMTGEAAAILAAKLAFVRHERGAQQDTPRSFRHPNGGPTTRQQNLTALADELVEWTLAQMMATEAWAMASDAARYDLEQFAERAMGFGYGHTDTMVFLRTAVLSHQRSLATWQETGLCYVVEDAYGVNRVWPICVPVEVAAWHVSSDIEEPSHGA